MMAEMYKRMLNKVYNFMKKYYIQIIIAGILSEIFYHREG